MRERLVRLLVDVTFLKQVAASAGDCYSTFVWKVLAEVIGMVLQAGVC